MWCNHWRGRSFGPRSSSKRCVINLPRHSAGDSYCNPTGLKRLDNGALVKDYEGPEKETEQAVQMIVADVHSEDPRFMEKEPPPLSEEFPVDSKVFFLGEHAYGVAAQISATTTDTLSVVLAVSCISI